MFQMILRAFPSLDSARQIPYTAGDDLEVRRQFILPALILIIFVKGLL